MKNSLLSTLILLSSITASAQQDSIQNPGFEQWNFNPNYDDIVNWTTLNPLAQIFGAELAFEATAAGEFHSGNSAIKIVTTTLLGIGDTPSILTNGIINTTTQEVVGGTDINSRPLIFGWWHRFDPIGADSAIMNITLTRWNSTSNMTEPVGAAEMMIGTSSGSWVNIEMPINYVSSETPDTVLILFSTGDGVNSQVGTTLFLDDLYYSYSFASVETPESIGLSIYPNPATDVLNIFSSQGFDLTVGKVFSLDGKLINTYDLYGSKMSFNIADLKTGTYIIELENAEGRMVRKTFLKN